MHSLSKRERNKVQVRRNIIHAAHKLFQKDGYRQTTLAEIAKVAGVSPRTIFSYFPSKESIVFYDHNDMVERLKAQLDNPNEPVIAVLKSFVQDLHNKPSQGQWFTDRVSLVKSNSKLIEYLNYTYLELELVVRYAIAREFRLPETALLPKLAAASIRACITHMFEGDNRQSSLQAIEDTLQFIEAGLSSFEVRIIDEKPAL